MPIKILHPQQAISILCTIELLCMHSLSKIFLTTNFVLRSLFTVSNILLKNSIFTTHFCHFFQSVDISLNIDSDMDI